MIRSMTGFGRGEIIDQGYQISCELKGVNHRYFDMYLRMSRRYNILEDKIKEKVKGYVNRGRIELNVTIEKTDDSARSILVDKKLALAYYKSLEELAKTLDISSELKIIDIYRLPDVYSLQDKEEDLDLVWEVMQKALEQALVSLNEMRTEEGKNLAYDIKERNEQIIQLVDQLEKRAPDVIKTHEERIINRIKELIPQEEIDENRIIQEIALYSDKVNIDEEIVRLKSHAKQFNELTFSTGAVGRKCDFLLQEMFREINTISSKANDYEMSKVVVEVKSELEKIREQVQNIE
ncbi:UPF0701 protein YicC [Candidatus Syntrophocurvum alkaliphilum]|uniref:UPF0701 protein YicC n=1 Tax=Candidatus Syntrophocurvum alkaliphilum TaxID=2293317 RepID=A0A6I6DA37_9FIRM|nr:YicC/YloC family endoribonuclease [Candidatus Syntrophocurvum alkaliphilum]QGT99625.1 UPF0701 protein YicC [Candidatus Syntrophocurvum alkaliphilum]